MTASVWEDEDYKAIEGLNGMLDILELNARTTESSSLNEILKLITETGSSPLFRHGLGSSDFKVETMWVAI